MKGMDGKEEYTVGKYWKNVECEVGGGGGL